MNADWTSAGNESRKKKRKPHHSCVIQLPPRTFILLGIYSYAHDEFNLWGNVRDSDGTRATLLWCEDTVVEGSQAARESRWKPFLTRWHKGLGQREKTEGHAEQESSGKQRGVGGAGGGGSRPEKERGGEETWEWNSKGCCHFLMLILISRMQSLVKILSDLCQILLQIKT